MLTLPDDRVLFFPITPFDAAGRVDLDVFDAHVTSRLTAGPGAVFAACGTGEFHALSAAEHAAVVGRAVEAIGRATTAGTVAPGAVPVVAGAGGPLGHAIECARSAAGAGADGLLVLPPYLVGAGQDGLVAYVEAITAATDLDVIVYHRDNARFAPATAERLFANPKVAAIKDGVGDIAAAQRLTLAARRAGRTGACLFNGLPTAELAQAAYDAIGVPYYSSAVFAMAPDIAAAYLDALRSGDGEGIVRLLDGFYEPFARLRDEAPGFAVALIKAGVGLDGLAVGSVRGAHGDRTTAREPGADGVRGRSPRAA